MICELRNKAAMLCVYIMEGKNHEGYPYVESETTLGKCILWVLFAGLITIFIGWWLIPLRILFTPILTRKFYCKNRRKD